MNLGPHIPVNWRKGMDFFRYSLPMVGGGLREGILLRVESAEGAVGWGDAAPLPGWSSESLEDVEGMLVEGSNDLQCVPSLACAIEAARASLESYRGWTLRSDTIPLNALLSGSFDQILERAIAANSRGCECFKIKTGGISPDELPKLLRAISRLTTSRCRFRIDPNRGWNFDTTLRIAESISGFPVDYLEEPLREFFLLPDLIKKCPIGIALDETLREIAPSELIFYKGAAALVLKPTLMGGFQTCADFAETGASMGMSAVVSACFESGVGIHALGRFALSLPSAIAAGLDTYSHLEQDVLCERLNLRDFVFSWDTPMPDVDISTLHPL